MRLDERFWWRGRSRTFEELSEGEKSEYIDELRREVERAERAELAFSIEPLCKNPYEHVERHAEDEA